MARFLTLTDIASTTASVSSCLFERVALQLSVSDLQHEVVTEARIA
jgi:hypothetical protein